MHTFNRHNLTGKRYPGYDETTAPRGDSVSPMPITIPAIAHRFYVALCRAYGRDTFYPDASRMPDEHVRAFHTLQHAGLIKSHPVIGGGYTLVYGKSLRVILGD